jgi:hypothetical protein
MFARAEHNVFDGYAMTEHNRVGGLTKFYFLMAQQGETLVRTLLLVYRRVLSCYVLPWTFLTVCMWRERRLGGGVGGRGREGRYSLVSSYKCTDHICGPYISIVTS